MTKIYFLPILLLATASCLCGFDIPEEYSVEADSLFNSSRDEQNTIVRVFENNNGNTVYYAATAKLFNHDIETVAKYLTNIIGYQDYFSLIRRTELIENYSNELGNETYFSMASVAFAKALFIGSLDSVITNENGDLHIYFNKNHDRELNKRYYNREKGILTVEFHQFNMRFSLRKTDTNKTRVLLTAVTSPKIWIPQWLFRISANTFFPRVLTDFENWLKDLVE